MILPSWIQNQVNILKLVGNDITILQSLVILSNPTNTFRVSQLNLNKSE